jgi:hypothetical protein
LGGKPSQQPTRVNHSSDHRILSAEPIADVNDHARARNADVVGSLRAHHIVDYTREDFADGRADYELIVDVLGRSSVNKLRRALARAGAC